MTATRFISYAATLLVVAAVACSSEPATGSRPGGQGWTPPAGDSPSMSKGAAGGDPFGDLNSAQPTGNNGLISNDPGMNPNPMLRDGQCAQRDVSTTRIVPTVWLVIDGSGSMDDPLGDSTRWTSLKQALMDPMTGVVKALEHDVMFGMIMFDGALPGGAPALKADGGMFMMPPATTCPRLIDVEPKKDNYADIAAMYPDEPLGGSTPTDKALNEVVKHLPDSNTIGPDAMISPTIVVLATDGEPNDFCSMDMMGGGGFLGGFGGADVKPAVITAVQQLAAGGNKTYVISLAGDDANLTQHLTDVAQAGMTGKPPFLPASKDELVQTFKDIIGPGVACDVSLNGKVKMGSECKGTLQINGEDVPCNDDNGWKLKDESTISILGTSCDKYKMDDQAVLHADFPCDVFELK